MTVNDMLILVRQRVGDMQKITFSDSELLYCLNVGMDNLCVGLATQNMPEIIKKITISGSTPVVRPDDFITLAGQFPIEWTLNDDNTVSMSHLDPDFNDTLTVKYYATKNHFTLLTDIIPFPRNISQKELLDETMKIVVPETSEDKQNKAQAKAQAAQGGAS